MKVYIFAILAFSQVCLAQSDLQIIRDQNPGVSNREVLKQLYNNSSIAAEINDFDRGDNDQSTQKCAMVFHTDGDNLLRVVIRQISKTTPGNGPMFPPHTEIKLNITGAFNLVMGKVPEVFYKSFNYIKMDDNAHDLIVYHIKDKAHSNSPFKLFLRKNGDLISFKMLTYKNNQDNGPIFESNINEDYGYCWRSVSP